jgi:quercetin dioxygenase-like cupin family protein
MARFGDELINPVTGFRTVFRKTAGDTGGELLQVDWIGSSGWTTGPDHIQPLQEERFEVLSGKLSLRVEGVERVLDEGEAIVAPAGSAHAAWNAADGEVHALVDFRPALRTEAAFETLASLARGGKTNGAGAPQGPVDAGPRPARVRGDLLRQPTALRPEGRLRGAGRGRAVARVPGRIPLLPVSQAERTLPDRDVTRRSTGRSGILGTVGWSHARNKRNARKERSTRNGSKV